jgi:hypothetical protein
VNTLMTSSKCFRNFVLSFEEPSVSQSCNPKLKCNNLIFNKILVLYASYVCLLHSCFVENHPIWIPEDGPLISKVVLSQLVSKLDRG